MTKSIAGLQFSHLGHVTRLKWYRLRRSIADPEFGAAGMADGFRLGTSMALDLQVRADGGFVVLQDETLELVRQKWIPVLLPDTRKNKGLESVWRFCHRQTDSRVRDNGFRSRLRIVRSGNLGIAISDTGLRADPVRGPCDPDDRSPSARPVAV